VVDEGGAEGRTDGWWGWRAIWLVNLIEWSSWSDAHKERSRMKRRSEARLL
jgi:hypothetical protein